MKSDYLILAGAAIAAYLILNRGAAADYATKLLKPAAAKTGGYMGGVFVPGLLDTQYEQGWGFGD